MSLVTVKMPLPSNFGRIVRRGTAVERIVEVRDATPDELAIDEMNAGIYAFDEAALREAVAQSARRQRAVGVLPHRYGRVFRQGREARSSAPRNRSSRRSSASTIASSSRGRVRR